MERAKRSTWGKKEKSKQVEILNQRKLERPAKSLGKIQAEEGEVMQTLE